MLSLTEGEDKPSKYRTCLPTADVMLLNKSDLLPHLDFDVAALRGCSASVNPRLEYPTVSARGGEGVAAFYAWIEAPAAGARAAAPL